jgi:hypothetical protein
MGVLVEISVREEADQGRHERDDVSSLLSHLRK